MFVQGLIFKAFSRLKRSGAWMSICPSFTHPVTASTGTGGVPMAGTGRRIPTPTNPTQQAVKICLIISPPLSALCLEPFAFYPSPSASYLPEPRCHGQFVKGVRVVEDDDGYPRGVVRIAPPGLRGHHRPVATRLEDDGPVRTRRDRYFPFLAGCELVSGTEILPFRKDMCVH